MAKKALVIGIAYMNKIHIEKGLNLNADKDAINMAKYLKSKGYNQMLLLCDGEISEDMWETYEETQKYLGVSVLDDKLEDFAMPTKQHIESAMKWLVQDARVDDEDEEKDDELFLYFAGHGTQQKGEETKFPELAEIYGEEYDEEDGKDECIVSYELANITDNDMYDILIKDLAKGVRMTAMFDCCRSGTILDLPYLLPYADDELEKSTSKHDSKAHVVLISACRDDQVSKGGGRHLVTPGLHTEAFFNAMDENSDPSYRELLKSIQDYVNKKAANYADIMDEEDDPEARGQDIGKQTVQLSTTKKFDLETSTIFGLPDLVDSDE